MNESRKTPVHLWIVGGITLLWNAMGAYDYLMTQTQNEAYMARFTPEQLEYFYGFPTWMVALWALAVWGGVAGSLLLLLRRRVAATVFAVSFVCMVGTTIYSAVSGGFGMQGVGTLVFSAVIFLVALGLVLYSRAMAARGVLV